MFFMAFMVIYVKVPRFAQVPDKFAGLCRCIQWLILISVGRPVGRSHLSVLLSQSPPPWAWPVLLAQGLLQTGSHHTATVVYMDWWPGPPQ